MPEVPPWQDRTNVRHLLSRHLVGRGVELGPANIPFPLDFPGTQVSYVDRLLPDEHRRLFPELGEGVEFPNTDIVCDLDVDRLKPLDDQSQDFVIASHVLEHVAEPIGLLDEIHRVLRPGGTALILLPDRRRTFDVGRDPTPLDHLAAEYEAQVTEVDDDHIVDFIRHTEPPESWERFEALPPKDRNEIIQVHRDRSVHVHCWHEDEFLDVLLYAVETLRHDWDFVDGILTDDEGPEGFEFGYVLRRCVPPALDGLGPAGRRQRFYETWTAWADRQRQTHHLRWEPEPEPQPPVAPRRGWKARLRRAAKELLGRGGTALPS